MIFGLCEIDFRLLFPQSRPWDSKDKQSIDFFFVLRKKGTETKNRRKEEKIEKGDCSPPTREALRFLMQRVKVHHRPYSFEDRPVVYPDNVFDSRLQGD